jgi:ribosomal protein S18 acetylase RimI-like enzyme
VTGAEPYPVRVTIRIERARDREVPGRDLQRLLTQAYVEGGFTEPDRAARIFAPDAVRARGDVLCAWLAEPPRLAGMVVVAPPSSPASRFAREGDAEMHLLATAPECRRMRVGRALVDAAMGHARAAGLRRMVLWTQASMHAAQRLYASAGFVRRHEHDFEAGGRRFMVFAADL